MTDKVLFRVNQGTDYGLEIALPYEIGADDPVVVTVAQGGAEALRYHRNDVDAADPPTGEILLSEDGMTLTVAMTQADTLRLDAGDAEVQVRVKTADGAETFDAVRGIVGAAVYTGELL